MPSDQPKRVVVVSELFHPETNATAKYLSRIAQGLAQDFDVTVICGQPRYDIREKAPRRESWQGIEIHRCAGTRFDKNKIAGRALNALTITLSMAWKGLAVIRRGDAVVAVTNPPTMPTLFLRIARWKHAKFALLVHDLYPEALIASGMTAPDSGLSRRMMRASQKLMQGSNLIIAIGRCMKRRCEGRLLQGHDKVVLIPNFADREDWSPARQSNPIRLSLGLEHKFVVQMAGNIGRTHGLEAMLDAAEATKDEGTHFMVVGQGARRAWLRDEVARRQLDNVSLHDFFPESELNESIQACDVQLISFKPGMGGVSVPSRMYNVMAAGIPLIACAESDSELALVIQEERIGWVVPAGDGVALAEAVRSAKQNRKLLGEMSGRAQGAIQKKYTEDKSLEEWRRVIHALLTNRDG